MISRTKERFITIIKKDKTKAFFAFIFYVFSIIWMAGVELPKLPIIIILFIVICGISLAAYIVYIQEFVDIVYEKNYGKDKNNIIKELKKIAKEIIIYLFIAEIYNYAVSKFIEGTPVNQTSVVETLKEKPISSVIIILITGPILEEFAFRFLPSRFIKNEILYIVISGIIFAGIHVVNDTNPFTYIWLYLPDALYFGYRYYKTKDILVPISLHMCNNFIATVLLLSRF